MPHRRSRRSRPAGPERSRRAVPARRGQRGRPPYLRLALLYLSYFLGLGTVLAYWNVYLGSLGFDARQIGQLNAILAVTKLATPTLLGWAVDAMGRPLTVLRLSALLALLSFTALLPGGDFWWYAGFSALFGSFWSPFIPLLEALTLTYLRHNPFRYSRIRLWGSLGFIAAVAGFGALFDQVGIDRLPLVILGLLGLSLLASLSLWHGPSVQTHGQGARAPFWAMLRRRAVWAYFLVFFLLQAAHGPYYVFFSLYVQDLGYNKSQTGLFWSLGVAAEVLLFLAAHGLLRHYSPRTLLIVALVLAAARWVLIGEQADSLSALLVAQILHAASFGLTHLTAMMLGHRFFHGGNESRGQALYSSLGFGLGGTVGSYYAGLLWAEQGPAVVFGIAAALCVLAAVIAWRGLRAPEACQLLWTPERVTGASH